MYSLAGIQVKFATSTVASCLSPCESRVFNASNIGNHLRNNNNSVKCDNHLDTNNAKEFSVTSDAGCEDPFGSAPFNLPVALKEKATSLRKTGEGKVLNNFLQKSKLFQ